MRTRRKIYFLGLSAMSLMSVQMAIADMPHPSPLNQHCCTQNPATDLTNAKKFARHSAPFRKAAEEAWRATHNGDAPFEAGFSIDKDGRPEKVQLSILTTVRAATHLAIVSSTSAMGSLHVHNKFGDSTPSPADIKIAKLLGKMVYVESRTGLYSVNPDGTVRHLFTRMDWFSKKRVN